MIWPLDREIEDGKRHQGALCGRPFALTRDGATVLLEYDDEQWLVGIPEHTRFLRLGPSLGSSPFLIFPHPTLVVPAGQALVRTFRVPLHLDIAALGDHPVRLRELPPANITRSLYGPVDGGDVCWTVKQFDESEAFLDLDGPRATLAGSVEIRIENRTARPHDVSKIMIPVDMIGLYDRAGTLYLSDVAMTLTSDHEAELQMEAPARAKAMSNVLGVPMRPARRSFALSHSYRNKTGLEYGF